jgi:hypothetical protein
MKPQVCLHSQLASSGLQSVISWEVSCTVTPEQCILKGKDHPDKPIVRISKALQIHHNYNDTITADEKMYRI